MSNECRAKSEDRRTLKNVRVIIVDDSPTIAQIYSLALRRAGFAVEKSFSNGTDVLEYFGRNSYLESRVKIVVIMDKVMPGMDGVTAATKLRKLKQDLKIIAVSSYSLSPEEAGLFDRVLRKPITREELIETVNSLAVTTHTGD